MVNYRGVDINVKDMDGYTGLIWRNGLLVDIDPSLAASFRSPKVILDSEGDPKDLHRDLLYEDRR